MTREIKRHCCPADEEEAKLFGGPFWSEWRHSLLDHLGIEEFPDERVENLLHQWWCLRMKLKLGILSREDFDNERDILFPPDDDLLEEDESLLKGVRYITERITPSNEGVKVRKI